MKGRAMDSVCESEWLADAARDGDAVSGGGGEWVPLPVIDGARVGDDDAAPVRPVSVVETDCEGFGETELVTEGSIDADGVDARVADVDFNCDGVAAVND